MASTFSTALCHFLLYKLKKLLSFRVLLTYTTI
jgi:hypothetical protein